jgi:hypothetical protein
MKNEMQFIRSQLRRRFGAAAPKGDECVWTCRQSQVSKSPLLFLPVEVKVGRPHQKLRRELVVVDRWVEGDPHPAPTQTAKPTNPSTPPPYQHRIRNHHTKDFEMKIWRWRKAKRNTGRIILSLFETDNT